MSHGGVKSSKNNSNGAQPVESPQEGSESLTPPPDGGWGWMIVFASLMIHVVTDGMSYSFGVFYTEFLRVFNEGESKTAWIASLLVGVTLSSGPLSGYFVNRYGCRNVTVAGALLCSLSIIVSSFANNVITLIFTIGIGAGLGLGLIYLPAIVSVTVWFDRYRSLATGIAVCGAGIGTFIFPPVTSALITNFGWRGAMALLGAFILNCIPLGIMFRPVPEVILTPVTEPMLPKGNKAPLIRSQSTEHMSRANGKVDEDVSQLTLSQPILNDPQEQKSLSQSRQGSGIMHRPDVLYQGSMTSLARYRSTSPERIQISTKVEEHEENCGWLPCSDELKASVCEMMDLSLLKDPIFILFCLSNFLTSIGFYIPYIYTIAMAKTLNIENPELLISIIGGANLIGRIVLGYISDKPWVNRLLAYNLCLTIAGISTALWTACWEFWGLAICTTLFGFNSGAYVGLTSVVLVDLLGLEKLTNAFGLLLLFQGTASLIGAPLGGWIFEKTNSHDLVYLLAGACISLSGLILFLIPVIKKRNERKRWLQDTVLEQL